MLIIQKIETTHFSSSQQSAINYILQQKTNIRNMTIKEIADASYTSTATIIRMAKKLGYQGYDDFKTDYINECEYLDTHFSNIDANKPFHASDNIQKIASKLTILAKETMDDTLALIDHDSLQQAIQILKKSHIIYLSAISYPLLLGEMFKLNMQRIGKMVYINHIISEELFIEPLMNKNDCLLMISYSGQIENMIKLASQVKQKGIPIILITGLGDNTLSKYADVILHISTREKLYSKIGGFSNENSIKLILDILYSCYYALDYDNNYNKRIDISKRNEPTRYSNYEIMKEDASKS